MAHFEDRSGIVPCRTEWGQWWQTVDEVFIHVPVPEGTSAKEIRCEIRPRHMKLTVKGKTVIEGELLEPVHAEDAIWTVEDKKIVQICLTKTYASAENCWKSLLVNQYATDPWTYDQMEQKLTLQRFQLENPGFDFSNAKLSGNYHGGGPKLPS